MKGKCRISTQQCECVGVVSFKEKNKGKQEHHLPPASIVTRMIPQDQISAGVAWYGFSSTSGAT